MAEPRPATLPEPVHPAIALPAARKWAITGSVMLVTIMQILDTSITNVALPTCRAHCRPASRRPRMLTVIFGAVVLRLPWMRRIRIAQTGPQASAGRVEGLPEPAPE
jgi:hypothetical protein